MNLASKGPNVLNHSVSRAPSLQINLASKGPDLQKHPASGGQVYRNLLLPKPSDVYRTILLPRAKAFRKPFQESGPGRHKACCVLKVWAKPSQTMCGSGSAGQAFSKHFCSERSSQIFTKHGCFWKRGPGLLKAFAFLKARVSL